MRYGLAVLFSLLAGPLFANDWEALDRPGAFAIMRHAIAPGVGDPADFDVDDCATQRNLDDTGRAQARVIGQAFRDRGHAFDVVLSSRWCRSLETARLLDLGPVVEAPEFNSFFRDQSARAVRTDAALDRLAETEGRPFVVTHQVNISALSDRLTRSGEVLVVRRTKDGLSVLGSILVTP